MTDFFDWLTASDSGLVADRLQERFRLSPEEMRRTTEALAPAFMLGLQRTLADPAAWDAMMRSFSSLGPDRAMPGFDPISHPMTDNLMGSLFGSDALAQAVARHASTMTGIAPDTIVQMMPSFALLTVQATMRMLAAGVPGDAKAYPSDGAGQAMAEMMRRSANAVEAFNRPSGESAKALPGAAQSAYLQGLFSDALRGGFPWIDWQNARPAPQATPKAEPQPTMPDPFHAMAPMLDMFTRALSVPARTESAAPAAASPAEGAGAQTLKSTPASGDDAFLEMMRASQSMQAGYAREVMALFERHAPKP